MKAIINLFSERDSWFHEFFNLRSPLMLSVAGKPLAHHLMDFCSNLQIEEVLLLDYCYDESIRAQFNDSYQWYSHLEYMGAKTIPNVQKLLTFHRLYCGKDDILILNGLFFIGGAPNEKEEDWKNNVKQIQNSLEPTEMQPCASGIYYYHNQMLSRVRIPQEKPIRSIQDYFNLNLSLLIDSRQCSLPGYKSRDNIIFGSTPVIMRGCTFNEDDAGVASPKHTILLGDNVRIEHDCTLKGPLIIGNNVIMDNGVHVERSIICDNTYLSNDLEIIDKIVDRNVIIDPYKNVKLVMDETELSGDTSAHVKNYVLGFVHAVFNFVMAIPVTIHLFICYAIFLCFFFVWTSRTKRWYFKFSLDKVPGVLQCLVFRKQLVGCINPPDGNSAVFTYSEFIQSGQSSAQRQIDDQYFLAHDSIKLRFSIIMTTLIRRIFQHDEYINKY
jgi:NDP-sugar pyrophosphorylase family protein